MGETEILVEKVEENQTRKLLEIARECKDKEEIEKRFKELLNKK